METVEHPLIDKSSWGPGPWQEEPDRIEFQHAGLPCLMVRHDRGGHWCGYAAVPPGHPLHGKSYDDADVEAHGGLTYAKKCEGEICHVPAPGEPDDVWWFGFDCAHAGDFAPGHEATMMSIPAIVKLRSKNPFIRDDVYRDMRYVRDQTERLAEQLNGIVTPSGSQDRTTGD
jgi:hypothetical protein